MRDKMSRLSSADAVCSRSAEHYQKTVQLYAKNDGDTLIQLLLLLLWHAPLGVCSAKRIDISLQSGRF